MNIVVLTGLFSFLWLLWLIENYRQVSEKSFVIVLAHDPRLRTSLALTLFATLT